jgi:hypothetical protein
VSKRIGGNKMSDDKMGLYLAIMKVLWRFTFFRAFVSIFTGNNMIDVEWEDFKENKK